MAVGVVQEQHPDRAKLYRQWKQLNWPILVDSLNLLNLSAVPIPMAIDEAGIVRMSRARTRDFAKNFIEKDFGSSKVGKKYNIASRKKLPPGADEFQFGNLDKAIKAFEAAVKKNPKDARAQFRLGVGLRRRADMKTRKDDDAQRAVAQWGAALALDPNQYIWRRRIQQYGPRLDKPYDFYYWVEQARKDIKARGEEPHGLLAEPKGSEVAKAKRKASGDAPDIPNPDPKGEINRDKDKMVGIETLVTPARVRPGHRVRVRVTFRLNPKSKPWWNNEADGLTISPALPKRLLAEEGIFAFAVPKQAESREVRTLEFELKIDKSSGKGKVKIPAYALYGVCEDEGGVCMFLRQDFDITVVVDPSAPKIQ